MVAPAIDTARQVLIPDTRHSFDAYDMEARMEASGIVNRPDPAEIWAALSSIDLKILDELAFLCRLKQRESQSGAAWCHPGRRYLATKLRRSIVTISRHVSKLRRLGVLDAFQPRPRHGRWQTNVYRLISRHSWRLARIRVLIERVAHRRLRSVHYSTKETAKRTTNDTRREFDTILKRWLARGNDAGDPPAG